MTVHLAIGVTIDLHEGRRNMEEVYCVRRTVGSGLGQGSLLREVQTKPEGGRRGFLGRLGDVGQGEKGPFKTGNSKHGMCEAQSREEHIESGCLGY